MSAKDPTLIVYDGECPFCSNYIKFMRLRDSIGPVELIDAREGGEVVGQLAALGYDLDEGMALRLHGQWFHGADCVNRLALLSGKSNFANKMNAILFSSPLIAKASYPFLRFGRNMTLRLLGRSKINASSVNQ